MKKTIDHARQIAQGYTFEKGTRNVSAHSLGSALANLKPYLSEQESLQIFFDWAGAESKEFKESFLRGFSKEPSGKYNPSNHTQSPANKKDAGEPKNSTKPAPEWISAGNRPIQQFFDALCIGEEDKIILVQGSNQSQSNRCTRKTLFKNIEGFFKADWIRVHKNPMSAGRGVKNITAFNHCMIDLDTDAIDSEQSIKALKKLPLPIISIVQTNENRFHALVYIGASDLQQAIHRQEIIKQICQDEGLSIDEDGTQLHKTCRIPEAPRSKDSDFKHRLIATRARFEFEWDKTGHKPLITIDCRGEWFQKLGKAISPMECWFNHITTGDEGVVARLSNSQIQQINKNKARGDLPSIVHFIKCKADLTTAPTMPSQADMAACLESTDFITSLPKLRRIIARPLPSLRDGSLVSPKRGYNQITAEYYKPSKDFKFRLMSKGDAVDIIEDAVKTIQFENYEDKLRYLCTLFDPFYDNLGQGKVPMILTIGNQSGIGKDACRELVFKIFGWDFEVQTAERDKTEFTKILGSVMASGMMGFHIDEPGGGYESKIITSHLRSSISGSLKPRLLGSSTKIDIPKGFRFSMSAKRDIILDSDMPRRCFPVFLHSAEEALDIDWERKNWDGWMTENADEIYSALHSIVFHWFQSGCPKAELHWEGQFMEWSVFVGSLVKFIMLEEPFEESPHDLLNDQVEVDSISSFMNTLCRHFEGKGTCKVADIINWIENDTNRDEIKFSFKADGKMDTKSKRALWIDLKNADRRIFNELTFEITDRQRNAPRSSFIIR